VSAFRRVGLAATVALLCTSVVAATLEAAPKGKRRQSPEALAKDFDVVTIPGASTFEQPSAIDWLPDGTMLVTEKGGKLWKVETDGDKKLVLDISAQVATERERGFNGVAVPDDFQTSRRVYLLYAFKANPGGGRQAMRLTYITLNDQNEVQNPGAPETVILGKDIGGGGCPPVSNKRDCPPSIDATHQGGTIIPDADGTLWVGLGDSNLPSNPGRQVFRTFDPNSTSGKILHIDSEGNGLPNHPFCGKTKKLTRTCTKVHAVGFRNPFRFSLTPKGNPLVGDVGWNNREEISVVKRGRNYGWPCFEGRLRTPFYREMGRCQALYKKGKSADLDMPVFQYPNPPGMGANGAAVIVGPHYGDGPYPDSFNGGYFYGDYAQAFIALIDVKKKAKATPLIGGIAPVELKLGPDGNLHFVDFITGAVRKLVYSPNNKAPTARIFASPTSGPGPNMTVNFSALDSSDPDGNSLSYRWDFDDDGVVDSTSASDSFTFTGNGTYTARLTVNDGTTTATANQTIIVGNTVPTASIVTPTGATLSRAGEVVTLQATGTDAEDGTLPPSAFHWSVVLFHKQHQHPLGTFTGNPAQFVAVDDHDADSHYEVTLRVTDAGGPGLGSLSTTAGPVSVLPESVPLRIMSRPRGVELSYGGREVKAPKKIKAAAIGFAANLSAPAEAKVDGDTYNFVRWKHGGRRSQIYTIPAEASKVIAIYKKGK
jgi:glucose/arabinose dehydrogenase